MTERAQVNLPVPRKFGGIENCFFCRSNRHSSFCFGLMKRDVIGARAMAALAGDSRHQAARIILIAQRIPGAGYDARGVTLQTTRDDGTREIHGAVFITRTVDPAAPVRPITYRQLKQPVIVPVEVALSSHPRPDRNLHTFAFSLQLSR